MSSTTAAMTDHLDGANAGATAPRRVAYVRAAAALVWAAAVIVAVGDEVPHTSSDVPTGAALLLATYPLIDVAASIATALREAGTTARVAVVNAVISAIAAVVIAWAVFGSDAGATLTAFGAWAAVSGAIQLGVAVRGRRAGRQAPMLISGGLSTVAGLSFIASATKTDANLGSLGGYMAVGAILFIVWAIRARPARTMA
jgi:uncharacterized membrane protein HdeD (DUF308 family)